MRTRIGVRVASAILLLSVVLASPVAAADVTGPAADTPFVKFRIGAVSSSITASAKIPLQVFWAPSTDESGISSYRVYMRRTDDVFRFVGSSTTTRLNVSLQPYSACCWDGRYEFAIRAVDGANNVGPYAYGNRFLLAAYQESHNALSKPGWSTVTIDSAYEQKVAQATIAGRVITFAAGNAQRIAVVSSRSPNRGRLQLKIDDATVGTVSTSSRSVQRRRVVWVSGALAAVQHSLQARTLDSALVDVDAILTIGDI